MMIDRNLIVPYRRHTLAECHEIIRQAAGMHSVPRPLADKIQNHEEWLYACLNEAKKPLNKWEMDFLTSVSNQLDRDESLTDRQIAKLEQIYSEKT